MNIADRIQKLRQRFSSTGVKKTETKSFEELSSEFSSLYEQAGNKLRDEDKYWLPSERAKTYEASLTPFIKENPAIADTLLKTDLPGDEAFALLRGMVGAMKEKPELSTAFLPKMTQWATAQESVGWYALAGLNDFVKDNPSYATKVIPLFETASANPPKGYSLTSANEGSARMAWEARENTKDYFLLATSLVETRPDMADKIDTMVGKFKKQVSVFDAISVDDKANGGKISERTADDWTYYHDCYTTAHMTVRKENLKNMMALHKQNTNSH